MSKLSRKIISDDKMGLYFEEFWWAVMLLETKDEVRAFFRDILTYTESRMLAKRLQIAKLLHKGADYTFIKKELKVSDTIIGTVSRWLRSFGQGYRIVLSRLSDAQNKRNKNRLTKKLWGRSGSAQLLAGAVALGANTVNKKVKQIRKYRSAFK